MNPTGAFSRRSQLQRLEYRIVETHAKSRASFSVAESPLLGQFPRSALIDYRPRRIALRIVAYSATPRFSLSSFSVVGPLIGVSFTCAPSFIPATVQRTTTSVSDPFVNVKYKNGTGGRSCPGRTTGLSRRCLLLHHTRVVGCVGFAPTIPRCGPEGLSLRCIHSKQQPVKWRPMRVLPPLLLIENQVT